MNTPKPVLNRMPQLRFLQGYRRQLAQTASGWTDNPALAKAALNDVMEIRSLQTEGILKYDLNSLDPAKYSEATAWANSRSAAGMSLTLMGEMFCRF